VPLEVAVSIEEGEREPEARYAIESLLTSGGLAASPQEGEAIVGLHYGASRPKAARPTLWIRRSSFFGADWGMPRSIPAIPLARIEGLPLLFGESPLRWERGKDLVETSADFVASAFFVLSGHEETIRPERDEHGRLRACDSLLGRAGLLLDPLVDRYADRISLELAGLAGREPEAVGEFAIVLSHDVDGLRAPRSRTAVDPILEVEARFGVRSTFFFLARKEDPVRPRYDLSEKEARRAIRAAKVAGAEVGLHGSYFAVEREGVLEGEVETFRREVGEPRGYRQHYLRVPPGGLGRLETAGFRWDSSLGWADAVGFRNGTARPFRPFDSRARRALNLVEIPLVAMDRTLQKYLDLDAEAAWEPLRAALGAVRAARGCASVLWHPDFFDADRHPGYDRLYERMVAWIREAGGRAPSGREVAREWRSRARG
jgi:peptidoglycan/xylan/chitin deacetylase (PgdA/CDA1 family)